MSTLEVSQLQAAEKKAGRTCLLLNFNNGIDSPRGLNRLVLRKKDGSEILIYAHTNSNMTEVFTRDVNGQYNRLTSDHPDYLAVIDEFNDYDVQVLQNHATASADHVGSYLLCDLSNEAEPSCEDFSRMGIREQLAALGLISPEKAAEAPRTNLDLGNMQAMVLASLSQDAPDELVETGPNKPFITPIPDVSSGFRKDQPTEPGLPIVIAS